MLRIVLFIVSGIICSLSMKANDYSTNLFASEVIEEMPISINCDILYLMSEPTFATADAEAWDMGFEQYLDEINGTNSVTTAYTKPDGSGLGLYDPNNTGIPISINISDYDLIVISPTTQNRTAQDLTDALKTSPRGILNFNLTIEDELGTGSSGSKFTRDSLFIDNTNAEVLFVDEGNFYGDAASFIPSVHPSADQYLWFYANGQATGTDVSFYHYESSDAIPGVPTHGNRVFLGYQYQGLYETSSNGGVQPVPASEWFNVNNDLTTEGLQYLEQAITLASSDCDNGSIYGSVMSDTDGDGAGDMPLQNVLIELKSGITTIANAYTDVNGLFEFVNIVPGSYDLIQTDPSGYQSVSDQDQSTGINDPDGADGQVDNRIPVTLAIGENDTDNNFVEVGLGAIAGYVRKDTNGDNIGDVPISGVLIELKDLAGILIASTNTDGNGFYVFIDIPSGDYELFETDAVGFQDVADDDTSVGAFDPDGADGIVDDKISVTLAPGEQDVDNDFAEVELSSITGFALLDTDNNGTGDDPFTPVMIELRDNTATVIATETTDATGAFSFVDLLPGDYTLTQLPVAGFQSVYDGDRTTGALDPDGDDGLVNDIILVTLASGEIDSGNEFVDEQLAGISGSVYKDSNNDGLGDAPFAGIVIRLKDLNGAVIAIDTTDASGTYAFIDVAPGSYNLMQTDSLGYIDLFDGDITTDAIDTDGADGSIDDMIPVILTAGESDDGNNFIELELGSISGSVFTDTTNDDIGDTPLPSVLIELKDLAGTVIDFRNTDASGLFQFDDIVPGDYVIMQTDLTGYQDLSDTDDSITTTDNDGGSDPIDDMIPVTLLPGEIDADNNFVEEQLGSILGTVLLDSDNDNTGDLPFTNIVIILEDDLGVEVSRDTTNAGGNFEFLAVEPGNYKLVEVDSLGYQDVSDDDVTPDPDGGDGIVDDMITVVLSAGEIDSDNEFVEEELGGIAGSVMSDTDNDDLGDTPIPNILIELKDLTGTVLDSVRTDATGAYSFPDVQPGDYLLMQTDNLGSQDISDDDTSPDPDGADGIVDDMISVILEAGEVDIDNDFVEEELGQIAGTVSADTDNDGVGDIPQVGVLIELKDLTGVVIAFMNTDATGAFQFLDTPPGDYILEQTDLIGYLDVSDDDSTPDPDGADGIVDDMISVTLTAGEADVDNDFIDAQEGSISGTVTADTDNDDIGDTPLSGVFIELRDNAGVLVTSIVTDIDGYYEFLGIAPGVYTLVELDLPDYSDVSDRDGTPDPDGDDGLVNDEIPVILEPGENDEDNNFVDEVVGTISGTVMTDTDNDDIGDTPIEGVVIDLEDLLGNTLRSTSTDATGFYIFVGVPPGDYIIVENDPSGYQDIADEDISIDAIDTDGADGLVDDRIPVTIVPAEDDNDNNFVEEQLAIISGYVLADTDNDEIGNDPIVNVSIQLQDLSGGVLATRTSDALGFYEFTGVEPGTYVLVETDLVGFLDVKDEDESITATDLEGADGVVDDRIPVEVIAGEIDTDNNFIEEEISGITGYVLEDNNNDDAGDAGLQGVTIELQDLAGTTILTTTTDNAGYYAFLEISAGDYVLVETDPVGYQDISDTDESTGTTDGDGGNDPIDDRIPVVLVAGETDADNNFIEEHLMSIGSTVFADLNGNGIVDGGDSGLQNITVELTDAAGITINSMLTDAQGSYFFDDLEPGDYMVRIPTPDPNYLTSSPGNGADDRVDNDDNGIQISSGGVTISPIITLLPNSESTNESLIGGAQDDTFDSHGDMTVDFGFTGKASIIGLVWFDIDGNGWYDDSNESGLNSVTVNLLDGTGGFLSTTTSDGSGQYLFNDLDPGEYMIEFITPNAYTPVIPDSTGVVGETMDCDCINEEALDNDADTFTGRSHIVTLSSGETENEVNAGFNLVLDVELASLSVRYNKDRELARVEWIVNSEYNNDYFIVERSFEGGDFVSIDRIASNGNTSTPSLYHTDDLDITKIGEYKYRLVQVDLNGQNNISNIVSFVKRKSANTYNNVKVYPNPASDEVRIEIEKSENESVMIEMFDLLGNSVNIKTTGIAANSNRADLRIDVSRLPKSTYIIKVMIGSRAISKKLTVL